MKFVDYGRNYVKMRLMYEEVIGDIRDKGRYTEDEDIEFK